MFALLVKWREKEVEFVCSYFREVQNVFYFLHAGNERKNTRENIFLRSVSFLSTPTQFMK